MIIILSSVKTRESNVLKRHDRWNGDKKRMKYILKASN